MANDLVVIYPILAILGLGLVVLLLDLASARLRGLLGYLMALGCAGLAVVLVACPPAGEAFSRAITAGPFSEAFTLVFLVAAALVSLGSTRFLPTISRHHGEYYFLLATSTAGLMTMAGAGDLITLYLGLELSTISLYPLAAWHKGNPRSAEAGLKYMLLGAVSSAVLLYGLTIVYGSAGSTSFPMIKQAVGTMPSAALLLGMAFVAAGFAFKVAAAPFHMWAPDVYEGAPTPVTAFLSVASKAAGFAVLLRVFLGLFGGITASWAPAIAILSLLSMLIGNLVAVPQTNLKRMLAYSGIAQAGYALVGVAAATALGTGTTAFFLAQYAFVNVGAFLVAMIVAQATGSEEISALRGLSRRSPLLALTMLLLLLSLGGIPPLGGFWGKLFIFMAGFEQGLWWLVLAGVLLSVLSLYYYLMVVRQMYIAEPDKTDPLPVSRPAAVAVLICTAVAVALVYPTPLLNLCLKAGEALGK